MKHLKLAILSTSLLGLAACGGGDKLSFKNADTVIKSYNSIIEDMTEADRQTFSRNLMLVLRDDETPAENLDMSSWNRASRQANDLAYLTEDHPSIKQFAGELALEGIKSLDGKSASYVNKRGAELKSLALKTEVNKAEEELAKFSQVLSTIETDRANHQAAYDTVLARGEELRSQMEIYKTTVAVDKVERGYANVALSGTMTLFNPHEKDFQNTTLNMRIKYNNHEAFYNINSHKFYRKPKAGETASSNFKLNIQAARFLDENGTPLDRKHELPTDSNAYELTMLPVFVRTGTRASGLKEYEYKFNKEENQIYSSFSRNLAQCTQAKETVNKLITNYENRIEIIKADKLDELKSFSSSYRDGCK